MGPGITEPFNASLKQPIGRGGQTELATRLGVTTPLISAREFVPTENKSLGNLHKKYFLPKKISA